MKMTFVGGGAHRFASTARTILGRAEGIPVHEIALHDTDAARAETMATLIEKCPEFRANPCRVTRNQSLDEALDGADLVYVVICVGNRLLYELSTHACGRHGFICSENITPSGAINALKVGPVILDIARRMERLCPDAWLLDFSNPCAVLGGVAALHTKIFSLGICEGFSNHLWDIPRLFGRDEKAADADIHSAGVNHVSFIATGSRLDGRDLYEQLDELIAAGPWTPPRLSDRWNEEWKTNITGGLKQLLLAYQRYGRLPFTTEAAGMALLNISGLHEPWARRLAALTTADAEIAVEARKRAAQTVNKTFSDLAAAEPGSIPWNSDDMKFMHLQRNEDNLMVLLTRAKAGETVRVATSVPNNGAIEDFPERHIVEFTQIFENGGMRPTCRHSLPPHLHGYVAALAAHQTLLADAIAHDCPETLVRAMSCYPVHRDTRAFWACWREVLEISRGDVSPNLMRAIELMPSVPRRGEGIGND